MFLHEGRQFEIGPSAVEKVNTVNGDRSIDYCESTSTPFEQINRDANRDNNHKNNTIAGSDRRTGDRVPATACLDL